ncbi:MAG: hypothetical protein OEW75_18115 [Cyclobacteriaceae bacterium]|nr:hypothetical protein [Cyclobacteriaceae bacterium]
MKNNIKYFLVSALFMLIVGNTFSQNNSKVYISKVEEKIYFGVYVNVFVLETLDKESAKEYVLGGDYEIGDLVKVPVQIGSSRNAHQSYVQIIGQVDEAFISGINDKVFAEAEKRFGKGNIEAWPEENLSRELWGIKLDEKSLNAKKYITHTLTGFLPHVDWADLGEGTTIPSSEGLIVFEVEKPEAVDGTTFQVKKLADFTASSYTLVLKEKAKAGKKGKNLARTSFNNLTIEKKTVVKTKIITIETESNERKEAILEAWEKFFAPEVKDEMIKDSEKWLTENINTAIETFFAKVDEKL